MPRLFLFPAIAALILISGFATAGEPDPNSLFNDALVLAKEGKTEQAVAIWMNVLHKVEPKFQPSVHRALGLGFGKLGRMPEAAYHIGRFLDTQMEAEALKTRAKLVHIEEELAKTHRKVMVACEPTDSFVYLSLTGDAAPYPCPLEWWFEVGEHEIQAARVGYRPSTAKIELAGKSPQRLYTVVLEPTKETAHKGIDAGEIIFRIGRAAKAGHLSVIRQLAQQHGDVFKGLSCDKAWDPAVGHINVESCQSELITTLVEAGVKVCPTARQLERAAELGCGQVVSLILPHATDAEVVAAASSCSSSTLFNTSMDRAAEFVVIVEKLEERVKAACARGPEVPYACDALEKLGPAMQGMFVGLAKLATEDKLVDILAAHPAHTRDYTCAMAKAIMEGGVLGEHCARKAARIELFYQREPLQCAMSIALTAMVRGQCAPALELVIDDVVPEDLLITSRKFNEDDFFKPRLMDGPLGEGKSDALEMGAILVAANQVHCKKLGRASKHCDAARQVENEMERIRQERERLKQPETILADLCLWQHDLDWATDRLAYVKEEAEISGVPDTRVLKQLAGKIMNCRRSMKPLAKRYQKASGKPFKAGLCK